MVNAIFLPQVTPQLGWAATRVWPPGAAPPPTHTHPPLTAQHAVVIELFPYLMKKWTCASGCGRGGSGPSAHRSLLARPRHRRPPRRAGRPVVPPRLLVGATRVAAGRHGILGGAHGRESRGGALSCPPRHATLSPCRTRRSSGSARPAVRAPSTSSSCTAATPRPRCCPAPLTPRHHSSLSHPRLPPFTLYQAMPIDVPLAKLADVMRDAVDIVGATPLWRAEQDRRRRQHNATGKH